MDDTMATAAVAKVPKSSALEPLRQALPFSYDTVASVLVMLAVLPMGQNAPKDKDDRDLIEKRQTLALASAIALGAAIRQTSPAGTGNFDVLVFSIGVIAYVGAAAFLLWAIAKMLLSPLPDQLTGYGVGTMLSSVVGTLLVSSVAFLIARESLRVGLLDNWVHGNLIDVQTPVGVSFASSVTLMASLFGRRLYIAQPWQKVGLSFLLALVAAAYTFLLTVRFVR